MNRPLCFVLMPLGKKHHLAGALVWTLTLSIAIS